MHRTYETWSYHEWEFSECSMSQRSLIGDKNITFQIISFQMQRAVVVNHDKATRADPDAAQNPSDSRISETAWLDEGVDERQDVVLARLNVRMNHMTSKRMMTSESLQVNNYGLGGYFAPHFDALHYNRVSDFQPVEMSPI